MEEDYEFLIEESVGRVCVVDISIIKMENVLICEHPSYPKSVITEAMWVSTGDLLEEWEIKELNTKCPKFKALCAYEYLKDV